jgi:hypothetical protein
LQDCDLCALCHQAPETMDHLLAHCVYTREVWAKLRAAISLVQPVHDQSTAVDQWLVERKLLPKDHRRGFDALFLLVSWLIWKERNSRVFERFATMPAWLLPKILDEPGSSGRSATAGCLRGLLPCQHVSFQRS